MALPSPLPGFFSLPRPEFSSSVRSCLLPPKLFAVSASSIKKSRSRKKTKSDADLCNDLREFVTAFGLPEGHVPSMNELLQHGRKDLANIVRRRGYKLITELVANHKLVDVDWPSKEHNLVEIHDVACNSEGPDKEANDLIGDFSSSSKTAMNESHTTGGKTDSELGDQGHTALKSSIDISLEQKVTNFIQNGDLDSIDDDDIKNLNERDTGDTAKDFITSKNVDAGHLEDLLNERSVATVLNGSVKHGQSFWDAHFSNDRPRVADACMELDTEKRENQLEINHLKSMLHQKELELFELKEQIEKEKLSLSNLQVKAKTEMDKARSVISEMDAELHAAEESLSGLMEVKVRYLGDGEIVEVAGSFNGWHHRIEMVPLPSSGTVGSMGSRKFNVWTTVLWLYPGLYEIKYIVDGQWRIDHHREAVTRGGIENNILRVEK